MNSKVRDETLWKLLDARCSQLTGAISNARIPLFLCLTWAFMWAWSLYNADFGYLNIYWGRYERFSIIAASSDANDQQAIDARCAEIVPSLYEEEKEHPLSLEKATPEGKSKTPPLTLKNIKAEAKNKRCREIIESTRDWANKAHLDSMMIALPGGFAKITDSDLGIVGQAGLLLLLIWTLFAVRRENHALRAIVDMSNPSGGLRRLFPVRFDLAPQDDRLSAVHLAYAYHAVAQRFMFIFSTRSRPLFSVTILLYALPVLVATWNVASDVHDVFKHPFWEPDVVIQILIGIVLYTGVCITTLMGMWYISDSITLLNGWNLAVRKVWMADWDETSNTSAAGVRVNVAAQAAARIS